MVEVATIGNEGMLGLPAYLGSMTSADDTFCQIPGRVLSMPVAELRQVLAGGQLEQLLGLYVQATFVQMSQDVACNQLHRAAQRAARWLLMSHDRVGRDEFQLTHEFLAQTLGVRRATMAAAMSRSFTLRWLLARRSRSNPSSGLQRFWFMMMPMAWLANSCATFRSSLEQERGRWA